LTELPSLATFRNCSQQVTNLQTSYS